MSLFRFFWTTHKWFGIVLAILVVIVSATGLLLLLKRQSEWIQPDTRTGAAGEVSDFITLQSMFDVVWTREHPAFASIEDIDRVDFRPGDRVFKVRSEHDYMEMQLCAITGNVLNIAPRRSDLIESIHDGSFFARSFRTWGMPVVTIGLIFLTMSGLWIWIAPLVRRRQTRRRRQQSRKHEPQQQQ